ncbi:MAG: DUF6145 family protein [Lachnospiraceae bacterium]|jgi:hypothetical protein
MQNSKVVLCAASAYEQKYYFNPDFSSLPKAIQDELKISCVLFTEETGGVIYMQFDQDGTLQIVTQAADNDFDYDEIDSGLRIKKLREEKQELFEELELYYKVVFLGKKVDL